MSTQPATATARAARELRALMKSNQPRLTGRNLAAALGVSQQSASRRMTGETPLDLNEIAILAEWLNVPVTRFTTEPAPATP